MKNLNNQQPKSTTEPSNPIVEKKSNPNQLSTPAMGSHSMVNSTNDSPHELEHDPATLSNMPHNPSTILFKSIEFQPIEVNPKATRKEKALFEMFIKHFELMARFTDHEFNLKHAAREIGTNEKYLSSAINNCTGMSFNKIVNKYRIEFAKKLIHDDILTRHNLEEIAYMSGYGNRTTFYRVFTETIGITPSRFRDNLNRGIEM